MQKIATFLWFDNQAEEAVNFYTSLFKGSKITEVAHYGEAGPGEKGSVMTINFTLQGQDFIALNGGPHFKFTEAVSLFVTCETQDEVDVLWHQLTEGGQESQCGWLKDKYGLSWQIIPKTLMKLMSDPDREKVERVIQAMLKMKKIDSATLQKAYEGIH
jgi:predicted 3-demethylubiquinone-9 3-methyltransferase (glyoxalase superfamily)